MMSDDLVEFLHARVDEDEQIAWEADAVDWRYQPGSHDGPQSMITISGETFDVSNFEAGELAHTTRHDPARVLRDVEAKRRILEDYENNIARPALVADVPSAALRHLALPYADHPDYRQEWKP